MQLPQIQLPQISDIALQPPQTHLDPLLQVFRPADRQPLVGALPRQLSFRGNYLNPARCRAARGPDAATH